MSTNGSGHKPKVLIVGGGVAGIEAGLALRGFCGSKVAIDLLAPRNTYTYRPLAVAEPFGLTERVRINLNVFAQSQDIVLHLEELDRVDTGERQAWCTNGTGHEYDFLIMATGAVREAPVDGAISFAGADGVREFKRLLYRIGRGEVGRVAFTAGSGAGWYLPMYELALMTAEFAKQQGLPTELLVVTPESSPLAAFGAQNSADVEQLLKANGIQIMTGVYATRFKGRELRLVPEGIAEVDQVVALPTLKGPRHRGLSADSDGFLPVGRSGLIDGCEREFAAGDATNFPVKQGGIAAQMADAAAKSIAVELGFMADASPFRPTLDGTLLTGRGARHLRQSLTMGTAEQPGDETQGSWLPMWKINAPFLCDYLGDHVPARTASGGVDADSVEEGLEVEWGRRVAGY